MKLLMKKSFEMSNSYALDAIKRIPNEFTRHKKIIAWSLLVPALLMLLAVLIWISRGITIGYLTRDPNAIGNNAYYAGFISQLGIFFWAGAAAICGFTWLLLSLRNQVSERSVLIAVGGFLTLVLGCDDVFQLHEGFFPHIGVPENIVLASYVLLMTSFLVKFDALIFKSNYVLFGMALVFFGFSLIVDIFYLFEPIRHLLEDGFKLFGIVAWFMFFSQLCFSELNNLLAKVEVS